MTLPNRVTPFGTREADPARGTLTGNRGCLGPGLTRRWQVRRWIACELRFKDWRQPLTHPTRWTPLFFLDEATALAAGHRPCATCRRPDFRTFRAAWGDADLETVDRTLHAERTAPQRPRAAARDLPDGAIVARGDTAFLVLDGALRPWSHGGYGAPQPLPSGRVDLLTPSSVVAVLRAGFAPRLHASALA